MKTRLLSSIVFMLILAVAFILKVFVSNYFFDALILFISCVACFEMSKLLSKSGRFNDRIMAIIFPFALLLTVLLGIKFESTIGLIYTLFICIGVMLLFSLITFLLPIVFIKKTRVEMKTRKLDNLSVKSFSFKKALNTSIIFVYPAFLLIFLTLINHFEEFESSLKLTDFNVNLSFFILLFAFLIPILTDTFAYLMGGLFGGKKIAPTISPKKTISGCIGGVLWCVLLSIVVFYIFNAVPAMSTMFTNANISVWKIVLISLIGSIIGQAGDLLESYIKRRAGVKDSGNIMPGHGGMLDRFDSHFLVAPFVFIAFSIIFVLI